MIVEPLDHHVGAVHSLAARYRRDGYDVIVEPRGDDLPAPLRSFQPDLIARRGDELIVAEVKDRRLADQVGWKQVERIAAAARAVPGGRFDLVVVGDPEEIETNGRDWSEEEVRRSLEDVEALLERERPEQAILLLYPALEARLRRLASAERLPVQARGISQLISALTTSGVLSRPQYHVLMEGLIYRNTIAHGRVPDDVPDIQSLRRLLNEVTGLIGQPHVIGGHTLKRGKKAAPAGGSGLRDTIRRDDAVQEQRTLPGFATASPTVHNLFFAVLPEPAAAKFIVNLADDLRREHRLRGKLMEPDRLHVSLLNLGAYARSPSDVIERAMEAAATIATGSFAVDFESAASFHGRAGARPLVLLPRGNVTPLMTLQQSLVAAMGRSGIGRLPRSRFTPHLTVLYGDRLDDERAIEPVSLRFRELVLIDSLQGEHRHDRLGQWRLKD